VRGIDRAIEPRDQANSNARSQAYWSTAIRESWQKSTADIIETGALLLEARAELERDVFNAMRLPFGRRTVQRLMAIAENSVLSDPTHVSSLPPSWGTLYELTKFPDNMLLAWIENGTINPEMERKEIGALLGRPQRPVTSPKPELLTAWAKASANERAAFCDAIGVSEFRRIWSLNFYRELQDSVRVEKFEEQPNVRMTNILITALFNLESANEPKSDEVVRKANWNAALNALGMINRIVRATGGKAEAALSLVPAGTLNKLRERLKRQKRAA
jgi:hypothetical protein